MSLFSSSLGEMMQDKLGPHVSIVMRTRNRPLLLVRALASVLAQKHHDWQLYLVNDGGDPDQINHILTPYRDAFGEQLTLIQRKVSTGMEAASNAALACMREGAKPADGFFVMHDDDDAWHPDFLLKTTQFLQKPDNRHFVGVATNYDVIYEEITGERIEEKKRVDWQMFKENISYIGLLHTNFIPNLTFLVRRDVVDKIGVFNTTLPGYGDWDFILRAIQIGDIGTVDEKLAYHYRRIKNDIPNSYTNSFNFDHDHTLYTNAMIRAAVQSDPHLLGLIRLLSILQQGQINLDQKLEKKREDIKYVGLIGKIRREIKRWKRKRRERKAS